MSAAELEDDEVEASRAPLLDHLLELRSRLFVASAALLAASMGCFVFAQKIYLFLVEPYREAYARVRGIPLSDAQVAMQITSPLEAFIPTSNWRCSPASSSRFR